jgi:hypothetical protein
MSKVENYVKFLEYNSEIDGIMIGEYMMYIQNEYVLERNFFNFQSEEIVTEILVEEENKLIFISKCKEILEVESESVN